MAEDYDVEVAELHAIAERDQDAFLRWFARSEIPMRQSLQSFAHIVDVEQVLQDTANGVWDHAPRITPDRRPGFLLRWARTVALNAARNAARRAGHEVPLRPDHDPAVSGRMMSDPFLRARIQRCLARLRTNPQRAFRARLGDGGERADRDLAASIGMSFDAFRQNLTRGRKALTECLGSFGIDVREYLR